MNHTSKMATTSWGNIPESVSTVRRARQTALYDKLNMLRTVHNVPIEQAFWSGVQTADGQIRNGEDYTPCFSTAGLHSTLSMSSLYNPYQVAYDTIISEGRNGWEQRINVPNAYYGTGYYMFRIGDQFYLVYTNATGEVNMVEDDHWLAYLDVGISPPGDEPTS